MSAVNLQKVSTELQRLAVRGWSHISGMRTERDLRCDVLTCHEIFQRILDVIESRAGHFTQHGNVFSQ